jgi:hypothetical protein
MTSKLISFSLNTFISDLNTMGNEKASQEAVTVAFNTTHRTLQQTFVRVVLIPILQHLAREYAEGYCDMRNASSGKLATKMLATVTDEDLHLPSI